MSSVDSSGCSEAEPEYEDSSSDDDEISAQARCDLVDTLAELGETIVSRIHPRVPAILFDRHDSWSYFVGGATVSDHVTWESCHANIFHSWGYQDDPANMLGVIHCATRQSRSEVVSMIRSLYPTGRIQVDPLIYTKQISIALRSVRELSHHYTG